MPRNVIFAAPFPATTTVRFIRAAAALHDVRLLGIVHTPPEGPDARLFDDIVRVTDPLSTQDLLDATEVLRRRHGPPDRLIGVLEGMQYQLAEVREKFGIEGTRPSVARLFRDKSRMKAALRAAGLPVARTRDIHSESDARAFAEEVGLPIVVKPMEGMGAKATYRVGSVDELVQAVRSMGASTHNPVLAEEFLRGRESSYETLTIGGKVRADSLSHYQPSCLEAMEHDWIQWCCLLPREITGPGFDDVRAIGHRTIEALGLGDGMTHMEWFRREDGSVAIGEIAQRPPGVHITRMIGLCNDIDPYRAWARVVIDGELDAPWNRTHAAGAAFLRGMGRGRVASVTGIHQVHERVGQVVVEAGLPTVGAPRSDSYEGDGYVIVRDDSTEVVRKALDIIINTVRVSYV